MDKKRGIPGRRDEARERRTCLQALAEAICLLEGEYGGVLVPEVGANLAYALPNASSPEEVAAFPGRLVRIDGNLQAVRTPRFGVSSHVAGIVLSAMRFDPSFRSAMNVRYSEEALSACDALGFDQASFDRADEPPILQDREGASLEWGVTAAIDHLGRVPDCIFDRGGMGKEPMIRILGKTPREVVDKALRLGKCLSESNDDPQQQRKEHRMELNEITVTRAIVERFTQKFLDCIDLDCAIVGGGPAGLVAGYYLAKNGRKVALFERKLSIGGGMWGGGMMFNEIVVQEEGKALLDVFAIRAVPYEEGYYTADAVEAVTTICSKAVQAGLRIFNCVSVEDVMIREGRVTGLVVTWSPVEMAGLHVDPLTVRARCVIDATGHATEILHVIERKADVRMNTETGKLLGERSLWADKAERLTLENTRQICPGVYVAGMSANAAFGGPRMGPIFGGMLLSGRKAAEAILQEI
jgi:thiamine thiazole synthase